ncbi:SMI1/KNR4 family protein [Herbidospora sp. NEAU-GS84]|uniref:SMI1/KNR4 family protein n=1 Tax=Herbidospora solisilvae TaxID=2696284 RepID=A0A7C9J830_9ACTN|nr:SMI1/KNR4 family protein [Herbidospora solisilvae]
MPEPLWPLLSQKNGFYAFESALHIFPWGTDGKEGAAFWNGDDLWIKEYGEPVRDLTFFAEDAFGFQFALGKNGFWSFDPETAERELICRNIAEWASLIIEDFEFRTGFPVMHQWQQANGQLPAGRRLAPAVPFFLGGEFDARVMRMKDSVELLRFRADIYRQVKDLPDGAQIKLRIEP